MNRLVDLVLTVIRRHRDLLLFSVVGTIAFIVDASIVWALVHTGLDPVESQTVAFAVSITVGWLLNRSFTFYQYASANILREWLRYIAANSFGNIISNGIYVILVLEVGLFAKEPVLAVAIGAISGLIFNFTASRTLVFRDR